MSLEIVTGSLLGTVLLGILVFSTKKYIEYLTKNSFDKNIETHKNELTKALKEVEFDYQRKIEDHALFTKKRHDIYAELYKKLNTSVDKMISSTDKNKVYPITDISNFDDDYLRYLLNEYDFIAEDIEWISKLKSNNNLTKATSIIWLVFDRKQIIEASTYVYEVYNYFTLHQLYINDFISKKIRKFINILDKMLNNERERLINNIPKEYKDEIPQNHEENQELLVSLLSEIRYEMRKELSIGDYVDSNTSNEENSK